jgi:hypothetical protein
VDCTVLQFFVLPDALIFLFSARTFSFEAGFGQSFVIEYTHSEGAQLWCPSPLSTTIHHRYCLLRPNHGSKHLGLEASHANHWTLDEYEFLTNINPATLNLEQQEYVRKRLETIEVEARIKSTLPYEVQRGIYQHLLRDSEPIDITRRENHVTPEHYTDPHVEFDYWRLTPFVYPTDNVHDAVTSMNALEFVENVLLDPTHMARFQTLNPPKQITFEVLIRWDFLPDFLPEISLANMDSLFDLLHVFDGDVNRIKLKFLF